MNSAEQLYIGLQRILQGEIVDSVLSELQTQDSNSVSEISLSSPVLKTAHSEWVEEEMRSRSNKAIYRFTTAHFTNRRRDH